MLLISKTLKPTKLPAGASSGQPSGKGKKKKRKKQQVDVDPDEIEYTNFEDEVFQKVTRLKSLLRVKHPYAGIRVIEIINRNCW